VPNGVRTAVVALKHHIPPVMNMDGNSILITYDGQPLNVMDVLKSDTNIRHVPTGGTQDNRVPTTTSWADVASGKLATSLRVKERFHHHRLQRDTRLLTHLLTQNNPTKMMGPTHKMGSWLHPSTQQRPRRGDNKDDTRRPAPRRNDSRLGFSTG
jgi:hypothetical protein